MNFPEKYQLLELLPGEGVESYRARRIRDGCEVTAHFLPGGQSSEQTKGWMARLNKLPAASMAKMLEAGAHQGRSFVVIVAPPFLHLHDWLRAEEPGTGSGEMKGVFKAPAGGPKAAAERLSAEPRGATGCCSATRISIPISSIRSNGSRH